MPLRPLRRFFRRRTARAALAAWTVQEATLRPRFLQLARTAGKPRGLEWVGVEWTGPVRFARDRHSGLLTAFAGVVVQFEPTPDGEMEDVPAARLPRPAAALFHYDAAWGTGGRAVFNLTPDEALTRMADQFEPVAG